MRELPGALRDPMFHHLVVLLSTSFYSWEMVAMVFLVEVSNSCRSSERGAAGRHTGPAASLGARLGRALLSLP